MKKFGFLNALFVIVLSACASSQMMASSALKSGEINLSDYKYVVIYDSAEASFMELELEGLMEANGFKVIGEGDTKKYNSGKVLGVRYTESAFRNGYGDIIGTTFTVSLEDHKTDKTLLTVNAEQTYLNRQAAWQQVSNKLAEALQSY